MSQYLTEELIDVSVEIIYILNNNVLIDEFASISNQIAIRLQADNNYP